jgi:hypothetical protein
MTGKTVELKEVSWGNTIGQIKQRIQHVKGIPLYKQCIAFDNMELCDCKTLSSYNIRKESTLYLTKMTELLRFF